MEDLPFNSEQVFEFFETPFHKKPILHRVDLNSIQRFSKIVQVHRVEGLSKPIIEKWVLLSLVQYKEDGTYVNSSISRIPFEYFKELKELFRGKIRKEVFSAGNSSIPSQEDYIVKYHRNRQGFNS